MDTYGPMVLPYQTNSDIDIPLIFFKYKERLISVIKRWCRNSEDFEDILQNIFLKIHSTLAKFQGKSKLETWLYKITVNECIDFYRKNRRFHEGRVDIYKVNLTDDYGNPLKRAETNEITGKLKEIIDELKAKHRVVFILYYFSDLSILEISRILRISKNAVRCRIYQAKQKVIQEADHQGLLVKH
jgi:RNA polymerase sigma-70 factor (ECF subfamily)